MGERTHSLPSFSEIRFLFGVILLVHSLFPPLFLSFFPDLFLFLGLDFLSSTTSTAKLLEYHLLFPSSVPFIPRTKTTGFIIIEISHSNPEFKSLKVYMASHLPETVLCPVDQTSSMEGSKVIETTFHLPIHTFSIIFI